MDYLWPKHIIFELKKYRGDMFDGTEYWCKIWRKTDLYFQKWHEKFGKFSPEHLKVSKFWLWWDSFIKSWKCMRLKFTGELFVMTMKKDVKLEEELTCRFKLTSGLCWVLTRALRILQISHFFRLPLTKVCNVWVKKSTEELCLMTLKIDAKFVGKLICTFKHDMRNLGSFHQRAWESRNWDFDGVFLSKVETVWA